jgi:circadian clock protein KaiC
MPISSIGLDHTASSERISTGIERLDAMLGGKGYYRGSSILISGTAGTGKSCLAAHFVDAACRRGEHCLYFAFEESQQQIIRNMNSIGLDLSHWVEQGLLHFVNSRSTLYGLEMHLVVMHREIENFKPDIVVIDPISNLSDSAPEYEVKSMFSRMIDYLKMKQITALCTNLTATNSSIEHTEIGISSMMDTWLLLQAIESSGERNRRLYLLKSRGMAHSNQVREFILSNTGAQLLDVYIDTNVVLTGSSRLTQEALDKALVLESQEDIESKQRAIERKKKAIEAQITILHTQFEAEKEDLDRLIAKQMLRDKVLLNNRMHMGLSRQEDKLPVHQPSNEV